jgi:hypothetical protein
MSKPRNKIVHQSLVLAILVKCIFLNFCGAIMHNRDSRAYEELGMTMSAEMSSLFETENDTAENKQLQDLRDRDYQDERQDYRDERRNYRDEGDSDTVRWKGWNYLDSSKGKREKILTSDYIEIMISFVAFIRRFTYTCAIQ